MFIGRWYIRPLYAVTGCVLGAAVLIGAFIYFLSPFSLISSTEADASPAPTVAASPSVAPQPTLPTPKVIKVAGVGDIPIHPQGTSRVDPSGANTVKIVVTHTVPVKDIAPYYRAEFAEAGMELGQMSADMGTGIIMFSASKPGWKADFTLADSPGAGGVPQGVLTGVFTIG